MPAITAQISITPIANGFIVADASADIWGGSGWNVPDSKFYASLDDMASDMPAFAKDAVERAIERDRTMREQVAAEQAQMADPSMNAQRQHALYATPGSIAGDAVRARSGRRIIG